MANVLSLPTINEAASIVVAVRSTDKLANFCQKTAVVNQTCGRYYGSRLAETLQAV